MGSPGSSKLDVVVAVPPETPLTLNVAVVSSRIEQKPREYKGLLYFKAFR